MGRVKKRSELRAFESCFCAVSEDARKHSARVVHRKFVHMFISTLHPKPNPSFNQLSTMDL